MAQNIECTNCLICEGETFAASAKISPFIIYRAKLDISTTMIRYCQICDFAFFQRRLSRNEASLIYANYFQKEYIDMRIMCEPSFADYIDENNISTNYGENILMSQRKDFYKELFNAINIDTKNILDHGGGVGSVTYDIFPKAEIAILDVDNKVKLDQKYDLLFSAHTAEHLSYPVQSFLEIIPFLEDEGLIFIETPNDWSQNPIVESLKDNYNKNILTNRMILHEHISFFNITALETLVKKVNLFPIYTFLYSVGGNISQTHTICLASKQLKMASDKKIEWKEKIDKLLLINNNQKNHSKRKNKNLIKKIIRKIKKILHFLNSI